MGNERRTLKTYVQLRVQFLLLEKEEGYFNLPCFRLHLLYIRNSDNFSSNQENQLYTQLYIYIYIYIYPISNAPQNERFTVN